MVEVASSRGRLKQPGSQHLQYRPRKLPQINMASCLHPLSRSRRNAVPGEAHQKAEAPSRATTGRFGAAGAAGRIVPEADGRVVCSLPVLAVLDHDRDGKPV